MDRDLALQRFAAARVAVLGTVDVASAPHLVPVTFALIGDQVVFAVDHKPKSTVKLRRLDNISAHPQVSFLIHEYDDAWESLWWVRIDADARIQSHDTSAALDALASKYPQYQQVRPGGAMVLADITAVSGWSFS